MTWDLVSTPYLGLEQQLADCLIRLAKNLYSWSDSNPYIRLDEGFVLMWRIFSQRRSIWLNQLESASHSKRITWGELSGLNTVLILWHCFNGMGKTESLAYSISLSRIKEVDCNSADISPKVKFDLTRWALFQLVVVMPKMHMVWTYVKW